MDALPRTASPAPAAALPGWRGRLISRLGTHLLLKSTVIPLFVTGFFAAYFQLLKHPAFPVTTMHLLALDRWIPFSAWMVIPYASLWLYVFFPNALVRGWSELLSYGFGATLVSGVGLGLFYLYPTTITRPSGLWTGHPWLGFLETMDSAGNACPSLHVAFAVLSGIWLERLLRETGAPRAVRLLNGLWCASICYSTIATRQHVTVDVLAGIALGLAGSCCRPRDLAGAWTGAPRFASRQLLALTLSLLAKLLILLLDLWPEHRLAAAVLFFGPDVWIMGGLLIPNTRWLLPMVSEFTTTQREVCLTIDDGPEPATTLPMLDQLEGAGAKATFFLIGDKVARNPQLVAEILRRGHAVGNHTQTHPLAWFWLAGPGRTAEEIDACAAALRAAGASPSPWFRPPAGIRNLFLRRALARRGLIPIGWTSRGREGFRATPEQALHRLQRHLRPGAILLLHEAEAQAEARLELLSRLLAELSRQGYRCVHPDRDQLR